MDWNIKLFLKPKKKIFASRIIYSFVFLSLYEREIHAIKDKKHLCGIVGYLNFRSDSVLVSDLNKTLLPQYKRSVFCFWFRNSNSNWQGLA